ncbi:MAG: TatD family hydrolase [Eubacteriales bacterium]
MKLFDTHTHLYDEKFQEDLDLVIGEFRENKVYRAITLGTEIETSQRCIDIAQQYEDVYAAVGIHPHDAKGSNAGDIEKLKDMAQNKKVAAIGEIGLDYHYDFSPRDIQMDIFIKQMELAKELNMPAVYHVREAFGDFLPMVQKGQTYNNAVMHCFGGSKESAKICMDAGMMISFTGVITFKNASKVKEVVEYIPLDRLMIETDCPYMAPVPHRGKRNRPSYVIEVARAMAEIKGKTVAEIAEITYNNATRFFGISE